MSIQVKIDEAKGKLYIEADLEKNPVPSSSGKSLVIASTRGNLKTDQRYQGKDVVVGLNVYCPIR